MSEQYAAGHRDRVLVRDVRRMVERDPGPDPS